MNIADNNVVRFRRPADGVTGCNHIAYGDQGVVHDLVQRRHDARGFLACVIFSAICWGVIAYFVVM